MKQIKGKLLILATLVGFAMMMVPSEPLTSERYDVVTFIPAELEEPLEPEILAPTLNEKVRELLDAKYSPLAPHTDFLLEQEHWRLIIAISAIESQYCTRQLGNNCWGITNVEGGYKQYDSVKEAIADANGLISRWQARGRWLTVDDMNCHFVVPCNENWVNVVNQVLKTLESYGR